MIGLAVTKGDKKAVKGQEALNSIQNIEDLAGTRGLSGSKKLDFQINKFLENYMDEDEI